MRLWRIFECKRKAQEHTTSLGSDAIWGAIAARNPSRAPWRMKFQAQGVVSVFRDKEVSEFCSLCASSITTSARSALIEDFP